MSSNKNNKGLALAFVGACAAATAAAGVVVYQQLSTSNNKKETMNDKEEEENNDKCFQVVFVLGGPGAGKGTQCQLLQERLIEGGRWAHLSAGDLLRAERQRQDSDTGDLINKCIANGKIVPAEITVRLLLAAMKQQYETNDISKFLIDGFPRSDDNCTVWDQETATASSQQKQQSLLDRPVKLEFVLNFECPEEVLVGRLVERGKTSGRMDDDIDVIRKRFQTFQTQCQPIVERYQKEGKVKTVRSDQTVEQVYQETAKLFQGL